MPQHSSEARLQGAVPGSLAEGLKLWAPVPERSPRHTYTSTAVALDATVELAAVLVLLEEGLKRVEEGHAASAEQSDRTARARHRIRD